jgi:uncharacterized protein YgiM (DUF1202 family)
LKKYLTLTFFMLVSLACFSLELSVPGSVPLPATAESTKVTSDPAEVPSPAPIPQCVVNATTLNLRVCAGTHCTAIGWLKKGDILIILARQDQWIHIETQSQDTDWVHSKFCTGEKP